MIMLGWVPRETVSGMKSGALRFAGPCFRQQHLRGRGAQDWAEGGQSVLQLQHGTPLTPGGALGLRCQLETSYIETGGLAFVPLPSLDMNSSQGGVVTLGETIISTKGNSWGMIQFQAVCRQHFPSWGNQGFGPEGGNWVAHHSVH